MPDPFPERTPSVQALNLSWSGLGCTALGFTSQRPLLRRRLAWGRRRAGRADEHGRGAERGQAAHLLFGHGRPRRGGVVAEDGLEQFPRVVALMARGLATQ
jgi:hypothetical protein